MAETICLVIIFYLCNTGREACFSPPNNGPKKNKQCNVNMYGIKIGFLKFKKPNLSISGKNLDNNSTNFFTRD